MTKASTGVKTKKTRAFIVDDHPLIRASIRDVLQRENMVLCGEAEDRQPALDALSSANADLVIIDLKLRNSDGLELVKDISHKYPKLPTLVLSMYDEMLHSERALRAGARGYVSKHEDISQFIAAVRKVVKGEIYWSQAAAVQVAARLIRPHQPGARRLPEDSLSQREMQVFDRIGVGANTFQIAAELHIDVSTVETYRARIKDKLHLQDATALLQEAIRWNVLKSAKTAY